MPKQVLVVDDEDKIREVIVSYLEQEGYQLFEARTGNEAIQLFRNQLIDLIILDLMLPDLSGESVCQNCPKHIRHTDHHVNSEISRGSQDQWFDDWCR
jgi:DNA-binding response OmpR family regulator